MKTRFPQDLFDKAVETLGSRDKAKSWVHLPNRAMGGDTPFNTAKKPGGKKVVEDILGRISHGVHS